jgi:myo-inositol-1(or 4)-monophosphatase
MVNADMDTGASLNDETLWLACAAHMAAAGRTAAGPLHGTEAGRASLGKGAGGDHTLEIDRACEEAIRGVLLQEAPAPHRLVTEEAGLVGPPDAPWCVVVDPVDGSLNAKHGLQPFGASIGVARGDTLADITVGYIEDYVRPQAYAAVKGRGLVLAGDPAQAGPPQEWVAAPGRTTPLYHPHRFESDLVEVMLLEAGHPDRHHFKYHELSSIAACGRSGDLRVRQIGSLALCLCYLATGAADVLVAAVRSRSVDLAAGFLILAESGGGVAALDGADVWAQPLDLQKRSPFVAWRAGLHGDEIVSKARRLCPNP